MGAAKAPYTGLKQLSEPPGYYINRQFTPGAVAHFKSR
jgi:hypothetical protein